MANIDDLKAKAAAERQQVQTQFTELKAQIAALQGQVLTPENVAELSGMIDNISEPEAPPV